MTGMSKNQRVSLQSWAVMSEDGDPAVIEREVKCFDLHNTDADHNVTALVPAAASHENAADTISGFAWHPKQESVLVSVMKSGRLSKCSGTVHPHCSNPEAKIR